MREKYFLKMKAFTLGEIIREDGVFSFIPYKPKRNEFVREEYENVDYNSDWYPPYFYPFEFYELGNRSFDYKVTHDDIAEFFNDRAMDKNRQGIYEYLMELGLTEWNGWEICKRVHATTMEDFFWITQDEHEDYLDVLKDWRTKWN